MEEKWSFRRELWRKTIHISSIFVVILYFIMKDYYSKEVGLLFLLFMLILFMVYEFMRLKIKLKLPFSDLARFKEKNKVTAGIYLICGIIISFAVLDEKIALASVLMVIIGDVVVGLLRHRKNIKRSWNRRLYKSAMFVEFFVNFLLAWFILYNFWISFVMALVAVSAEAMFDSEDNLVIPLFAGFVGQMLLWVI